MARVRGYPMKAADKGLLIAGFLCLCCTHHVRTENITQFTNGTVSITLQNGTSFQIYPAEDASTTDTCPGAAWKNWRFRQAPQNFDPLNWSTAEWRQYALDSPLRSASLSLAFLLIGLLSLGAALLWRAVQWCVGCGRCSPRSCSAGAEEPDFLGDRKHGWLKVWCTLLLAAAAALAVWGMLALDEQLVAAGWGAARDVLAQGEAVAAGMGALRGNLTQTLPYKLNATQATLRRLVAPEGLAASAQEVVRFTSSSGQVVDSLVSSATSLHSALTSQLLPGLKELSAQLLNATTAAPAAAATSPQPPYDTLSGLLPPLAAGLPLLAGAEASRAAVAANLTALQAACQLVQSAAAAPSPAALEALRAALGGTGLARWQQQMEGVRGALQAYNASRSGPALGTTWAAAQRVVAGAAALSPPRAAQLEDSMRGLGEAYGGGPRQALQSLSARLATISSEVVDAAGWELRLRSGTLAQVVNVTNSLLSDLDTYVLVVTTDNNQSTVGQQQPTATLLIEALPNASTLASSLSSSAASLVSAAQTTQAAAAGGPSPAAATAHLDSLLLPSLDRLSDPTSALTTALAAYDSAATPTTQQALKTAVTETLGPLESAVSAFGTALPDSAALASTATSMMQGPVPTLGSAASALAAAMTNGGASGGDAYGLLSMVDSSYILRYVDGMKRFQSLADELPSGDAFAASLQGTAEGVLSQVSQLADQVLYSADLAGQQLQEAVDTLQTRILQPGNRFISRHQGPSEHWAHVTYAVWMALWGLVCLLLLLLAAGVWGNWPGGVLAAGLLLLALVTASQALCVLLAAGMGAMNDACANAEEIAVRKAVQDANDIRIPVVLSYYLYGDPPYSRDEMLASALGVNVSALRGQLRAANDTLGGQLGLQYVVRGTFGSLLSDLGSFAGNMYDTFDQVLTKLSYGKIHSLYGAAKSVACCRGGNLAYHQWCALTAAAALVYGALIAAAYLLARMDMLRQRRGCCGCCSCVCYSAYGKRRADEEAAEDMFAKEAQRRQQQRRHEQALTAAAAAAAGAAAAAAGGGGGKCAPAAAAIVGYPPSQAAPGPAPEYGEPGKPRSRGLAAPGAKPVNGKVQEAGVGVGAAGDRSDGFVARDALKAVDPTGGGTADLGPPAAPAGIREAPGPGAPASGGGADAGLLLPSGFMTAAGGAAAAAALGGAGPGEAPEAAAAATIGGGGRGGAGSSSSGGGAGGEGVAAPSAPPMPAHMSKE